MCGIIFYSGYSIPIRKIFDSAVENKHRGNEDGFGYIDIEHNKIVKTVLTFEEIKDKKLGDRKEESPNIKGALTRRLNEIDKSLDTETTNILFHHRSATNGAVRLSNTHPIQINTNVFYIHNGTVEGSHILRNYMKEEQNTKFNSYTDTEVIGRYIERKMKENCSNLEIYNKLKSVFYNFGVIARYDKSTKETIIFKDSSRPLYLFTSPNEILLISEPLFSKKEFEKCIRIDKGILHINSGKIVIHNGIFKDVTEKLKKFLEMKNDDVCSCDNCKSKANKIRFKHNKDYCLVCLTSDSKLEGVDKETEETKTETYDEYNEEKFKRNGLMKTLEENYNPNLPAIPMRNYEDPYSITRRYI